MLMVDDDNILSPDYLQNGLAIRLSFPQIEVFGGSIIGEFEELLEDWMVPYLSLLAIREVKEDIWSNVPHKVGFYPCGAGMFLTRNVAKAYINLLAIDSRRIQMDRRGKSLASGGDCDICFLAENMKLGVGLFSILQLTHLIPAGRMKLDYLLRLSEGITISGLVLSYLWGRGLRHPPNSIRRRFGLMRMRARLSPIERQFFDARLKGEKAAATIVRKLADRLSSESPL
jgi:hypothetical protein